MGLEVSFEGAFVRQDLTSDGSEFHVCGAATGKDRRANSVCVFGTISSGASDDRRGRTGIAVWIRSFKYAGVEEDIVLNVSAAILCVTRCLTGSQWSDLRSGLASVRPPRWQTTLARIWCILAVKIWHLVATILIPFLRINLPHCVQFKHYGKSV